MLQNGVVNRILNLNDLSVTWCREESWFEQVNVLQRSVVVKCVKDQVFIVFLLIQALVPKSARNGELWEDLEFICAPKDAVGRCIWVGFQIVVKMSWCPYGQLFDVLLVDHIVLPRNTLHDVIDPIVLLLLLWVRFAQNGVSN